MLELLWTHSGKQSVEGRDYSYFSPTFQIDPDGSPSGLPDNGAIGALVNNPAFRDMQRIAASHARTDELGPGCGSD
jgi:phage I-like protein